MQTKRPTSEMSEGELINLVNFYRMVVESLLRTPMGVWEIQTILKEVQKRDK